MALKKIKSNKQLSGILLGLLAAIFYAVNTPFSKMLLGYVSPYFMASFLYLGAGLGIGILYVFRFKNEKKEDRLSKSDLPYTILMVLLDIAAPILLMYGIKLGSASNASLLGNFEIVATALIACIFFKEKISIRLCIGIVFILASSLLLSFNSEGLKFSLGSLLVILATICWGLENNCTRKISNKSTYEIVTIKGICSGLVSLIIGLCLNEPFPEIQYFFITLALGFVAYGLSIFTYVRSQKYLGAAKTSALYALAPFIGVTISLIVFHDSITYLFYIALGGMIIGTIFVIDDIMHESGIKIIRRKKEE